MSKCSQNPFTKKRRSDMRQVAYQRDVLCRMLYKLENKSHFKPCLRQTCWSLQVKDTKIYLPVCTTAWLGFFKCAYRRLWNHSPPFDSTILPELYLVFIIFANWDWVKLPVGDSGFCCVCVTSFERYLALLFADFEIRLYSSLSLLSLIHIWRCRRDPQCRSRWSPYH